jgi:hypothetical protein
MAETLDVTTMIPNKWEPLRKNRWLFAIEGVDAFLLKTAARPQIATGEIVVDWINSKRYLMGKYEQQALNVVLYDPIAPSGAQQVMEWIRLHHEVVSGRSGYADFYKRDVQIKLLDPIGTVVQLWDLKGCFLTDSNFNDLDYAAPDAIEIALTIRYDLAVLQY